MGDHRNVPAPFFELRQSEVRRVRTDPAGIQLLSVKLEKDIRVTLEAFVTEQIFGRISLESDVVLIVKPVLASEVGHSAFGGDPGASEESDLLRLRDEIAELLYLTDKIGRHRSEPEILADEDDVYAPGVL